MCVLLRLDPNTESKKFLELLTEGLDLMPNKINEARIESYFKALEEIFNTMLFHDFIFKEVQTSEGVQKIYFFENLFMCLGAIDAKLNLINKEDHMMYK
jgi:hypothetical protein